MIRCSVKADILLCLRLLTAMEAKSPMSKLRSTEDSAKCSAEQASPQSQHDYALCGSAGLI